MPFVNPLTVTVLLSEIDFFFWPCMSGEKYPPTHSVAGGSTATYTSVGVYPCMEVFGPGTATTCNETWPASGTYSPRTGTFTGLTFTGKFQASNTGPAALLAQLYFTGSGLQQTGFQCTVGNATFTVAGIARNNGFSMPGTLSNDTWYDFSYTITAAGAHSATLGTLTGSRANGGVPTVAAQNFIAIAGNGTNRVTARVSRLKVTYT